MEVIEELRELLKRAEGQNFKLEPEEELRQKISEFLRRDNLTPETVAAAYARISRNPLPVDKLRAISRNEVEKARKSNETIIFDYGHSSIAEHAVFNFDIIGISRFLVEKIQKHRLCSFTEKSQRYVLFKRDYVIPEEIGKSRFLDDYVNLMEIQSELYHKLYELIEPDFRQKYPELPGITVENLAKEDARYIVPLATKTQLGATINARNIEYILRKAFSSNVSEYSQFGNGIYSEVSKVATSLVKHFREKDYVQKVKERIKPFLIEHHTAENNDKEKEFSDVTLVRHTANADDYILSFILATFSDESQARWKQQIEGFTEKEKLNLFRDVFQELKSYDSLLREFEMVDFVFELIISASCYAQLKRHRMATLIIHDYNPAFGNTIPDSVRAVSMEKEFNDVVTKTNELYYKIKEMNPDIAPYVLTNSHKRRVYLKTNVRELYHISRLREDESAQWDIRKIAEKIMRLAKEKAPLIMMLACGKDRFESTYKNAFEN